MLRQVGHSVSRSALKASDVSKLKNEIEGIIRHSTTKLILPLLILFYLEYVEKRKNPRQKMQ